MNAAGGNPLIADIRRAEQQLRNGRRADAVAIYEDVAGRAADDVAVHIELGRLCLELGAPDEAGKHYAVAVEKQPDNAHFLGYLAVARQQAWQAEEAYELFRKAAAIDPDIFEVMHGLGVYFMGRSDYLEAREYLERALKLRQNDAGLLANLATTLMHLDEHERALKFAEKALRLDPTHPNTHYAVGNILTQLGRTDDAIRHFENTIRRHPTFGAAYDIYVRTKKFSHEDKAFIDKTEKILQRGMPSNERICLHYALGKVYDDCGEWDKAFDHYSQGNLLKRKPFDLKRERRTFKQMKKVYTSSSLAAYRSLGNPAAVPVFIVGMPRSGTTLMERMIASHPDGAAAGELSEMSRIAQVLSSPATPRQFAATTRANLTADNVALNADEYLRVLRQGRERAGRIVDKQPFNYYHLGQISVLFPNATIIHAIRHPLDVCLSCHFQNFTNIRWANDLGSIAAVYRLYREFVDYWRQVLPTGKIVDVVYEALVEDPETQGKRLLEACGLRWDASLLEFYRQKGVVRTASLGQVRQPIYRSSRMRWKNYAAHLTDLARDLAEYLQDDREELAELGIHVPRVSGSAWVRRLTG
jgi:tetratricopeptide (TPR) repeat protein